MGSQRTSNRQPTPDSPDGDGNTSLRALAYALSALSLLFFIVGLPTAFERMSTTCVGPRCSYSQLTPSVAVDLAARGFSMELYALSQLAQQVLLTGTWAGIGLLIFRRGSGDRMALLASVALIAGGVASANDLGLLAGRYPFLWPPVAVANTVGQVSFFLFLYVFPDGRIVPRRVRPFVALVLLALTVGYLFPRTPVSLESWPPALQFVFPIAALGGGIAVQIYRYRCVSGPDERRQTRWVVLGIGASSGGFLALVSVGNLLVPEAGGLLSEIVVETVLAAALFPIPLSIGVAVLRHRLWGIDLVLNRTLVYGALTASLLGLYALVVGGAGAALQARGNAFIPPLAAGLVSVLFAPLRDRLQRVVNRLMYGERDDPYGALSGLGQRLEGTLTPDAVLLVIVQTVRDALRLPYVAIALARDGAYETAAATGESTATPLRLPLTYQAETVGALILAPRAGEQGFGPADRRLLEDLARQAGVAAHAVRLTADVRRSRERLVAAREEERRRLRRDLHDGLGPALSSAMLKIGAARRLLPPGSPADGLLAEVRGDLHATVADIRRLVYDLRPPALDQLGLPLAIRDYAERCGTPGGSEREGPCITVETPETLPPLPAAVEVAAYRIAQEALTNVARHARAGRCAVHLALEGDTLCLEVADDGVGMAADRHAGVGLPSMRERAEELGGSIEVASRPGAGTRVLARLPVAMDQG